MTSYFFRLHYVSLFYRIYFLFDWLYLEPLDVEQTTTKVWFSIKNWSVFTLQRIISILLYVVPPVFSTHLERMDYRFLSVELNVSTRDSWWRKRYH